MPDDPPEARALRRLLRTSIDSAQTRRLDTRRELPRDTEDLDALIINLFWPQAIRPLLANGLAPHIGTDDAEPSAPSARSIPTPAPPSSASTIPTRPLADRPARTRWYCRFGLEVRATGYMLDKMTILSFPADFELDTLARFLREPLMAGCPASLSYNHTSAGSQPSYEITLQTGAGAGWGRRRWKMRLKKSNTPCRITYPSSMPWTPSRETGAARSLSKSSIAPPSGPTSPTERRAEAATSDQSGRVYTLVPQLTRLQIDQCVK